MFILSYNDQKQFLLMRKVEFRHMGQMVDS